MEGAGAPPARTRKLTRAPLQDAGRIASTITLRLLEFDPRFAVFGADFVPYDFAAPLRGLPAALRGAADRVLVDPPFLSDDCQTKSRPCPSAARALC